VQVSSGVRCFTGGVRTDFTTWRGFFEPLCEKVDIENDDIDGQYDLLFFMDTLDYIHGRRRIASVCDKLIRIVGPGGYLVFCGCRLWDDCLRNAWWQHWLPEGADQHLAMLARHHGLQLVQQEFHGNIEPPDPDYEDHLSAIFQKCAS
jgi:hypothetical protein